MLYRVLSILIACLLLPAVAIAEEAEPLAAAEKPATIASADVIDDMKDDVKKKVEKAAPRARVTPPQTALQPVNGRIIHHSDAGRLCIGGVHCPNFCKDDGQNCKTSANLTIRLDEPTRINTIQLSAHDNIGKSRRSRLIVKVNGKEVADTLVYRNGSTLTIEVGATGELITIESAHQYNGFLRGGEEALIWDVYVFGGEGGRVAKHTPEPDA